MPTAGDRDLGRLVARIGADLSEWEEAIQEMESDMKQVETVARSSAEEISEQFNQVGKNMQKVGMAMTKFISIPLAALGGLSLFTAGEFEKAMKRTKAITGSTGDALEGLEMQARELGETTVFSAKEAAQGMSFLAMAGFEVNEIMGAMPSVLDLAAAGQFDLAKASDIASDVVRAFGFEAKETARVSDVMAKSFINANIELGPLGNALSFAAPVAHSFGVSIEETVAALSALSDAGIKGGRAGRTLRIIFTQLARKADDLGLNIRNADGSMRSFADMIEELEKSAIRANETTAIFGARAGAGLPILLQKGSKGLREFTKFLEDSGGTAKFVAETQLEGLLGQLVRLESAFSGLQIAIAETGLLQLATSLATKLTELTRWVANLDDSTLRWATAILTGATAAGFLTTAVSVLTKVLSFYTGTVLSSMGVTAQFNNLLLATPWGAVAGGLALLVGYYVSYSSALAKASNQTIKESNELNRLVLGITNANVGQDERNKLITELQSKYPDFLKNIDAETVSNGQLTSRLKEANSELAKRIILEEQKENIDELAAKAANARVDVARREIDIEQRVIEASRRLGLEQELVGKSTSERIRIVEQALEKEAKWGVLVDENARALSGLRQALTGLSLAQAEASRTTKELNDLQDENQKILTQLGIGTEKSIKTFVKYHDTVSGLVKQISTFGTSLDDLSDAFDPTDEKASKLQEEIGKIEDTFNKQIATIGRTAQVYQGLDKEYDVTEEKMKAVEQALASLIELGLSPSIPIVIDLRNKWRSLRAELSKPFVAFELPELDAIDDALNIDIDTSPAEGSVADLQSRVQSFDAMLNRLDLSPSLRVEILGIRDALQEQISMLQAGEFAFVQYSDAITSEGRQIIQVLDGINSMMEDQSEQNGQMRDEMTLNQNIAFSFLQTLESGLANAITSGKELTKVLNDIGKTILKAGIQMLISFLFFGPAGIVPGGKLGGFFKGIGGGATEGLAKGGDVVSSGVFKVGESGVEHVFLPAGTSVRPTELGSGSGRLEATINVVMDGRTVDRQLQNIEYKRSR